MTKKIRYFYIDLVKRIGLETHYAYIYNQDLGQVLEEIQPTERESD